MHKQKHRHAYEDANLLSKLLFVWVMPFLKRNSGETPPGEGFSVPQTDEARKLGNGLEKAWTTRRARADAKGKPTRGLLLLRCIFSVHGTQFVCLGLLDLFNECVLRVLQPICVRLLVQSFTTTMDGHEEQDRKQMRYLYGGALCLTTLLYSLVIHTVAFHQFRLGMRTRVALSVMVFRKALRLSLTSAPAAGRIANLLATDVTRFDNAILIPYIVIGPLQLCIFSWLLWCELGWHAFAMVGIVALLLPLQYIVFRYSSSLRLCIATRTDDRTRFMNEFLNAIAVLKMYAWERPFSALVAKLRGSEVKELARRARLQGAYLALFNASGKLLVLSAVLSLMLSGEHEQMFTADRIFFCVSIANTLLYANLFCIPSAAAQLAGIIVSLRRLQEFFLLPEQEGQAVQFNNCEDSNEPTTKLELEGVQASWTSTAGHPPTLNNLNLQIHGPKLVMVVGAVGSGKSSLLHVLLGELPPTLGRMSLKTRQGSTSYAPQEPWCFPGTVRDNILFGHEYDPARYAHVLHACCLEDDIRLQWPNGDQTWVGGRGEMLSGGQRSRVNLARAMYAHADVYLLDDPLASVDARVANAIFERAIRPSAGSGEIRVLVTHQLQFLPYANHVLVLQKGKVLAQGSYAEVEPYLKDLDTEEHDGEAKRHGVTTDMQLKPSQLDSTLPEVDTNEDAVTTPSTGPEQLVGGGVSLKTYANYLRALGSWLAVLTIAAGFVATQVFVTFCEYWLSRWTNWADDRVNNSGPQPLGMDDNEDSKERWLYLWVYTGAVGVTTILLFLLTTLFFHCTVLIARNLHNLLGSVSRACMHFWHGTSSGRVLNRFTKDVCAVDEILPETLYNTMQSFLQMLGVLVIVSMSSPIWLLGPTALVLGAFYVLRKAYIRPARRMKRLEAESRSALFTTLNSSMLGLTVIRSAGAGPGLSDQFESAQDANSGPFFLFLAMTRWFAIWLDTVSVLYLTTITFSFLILAESTLGGNLGVAISAALVLNLNLQLGMRQSAEAENNMISVERILEMTRIEQEPQAEEGGSSVEDWTPIDGRIQFESVSLRYGNNVGQQEKEGVAVLHGLTFNVAGGQHVGVVGRTGAGKSSLINALFRLTEPEGSILIDGVPTVSLPLSTLRRRISIIPQEPVLFAGSLRFNLDPLAEYTDAELWRALETVQLQDGVRALDAPVRDGGANFSVGERQLLCLARAILRSNRIVVLDEATANVDPRTDALIRSTIKEQFAGCTVITIAHRLNSVLECDRVLVLDTGKVLEYDRPEVLLQNPDGAFTGMVKQQQHKQQQQQQNDSYNTPL